MILNDKVSKEDQQFFLQYIPHSLQFIDFEEIPEISEDFTKEFKEFLNPCMANLFKLYKDKDLEKS